MVVPPVSRLIGWIVQALSLAVVMVPSSDAQRSPYGSGTQGARRRRCRGWSRGAEWLCAPGPRLVRHLSSLPRGRPRLELEANQPPGAVR